MDSTRDYILESTPKAKLSYDQIYSRKSLKLLQSKILIKPSLPPGLEQIVLLAGQQRK